MSKRFLLIFVVLFLGKLCLGQQVTPDLKQQARDRAKSSLYYLADQTRSMDDPTFRIFLRLRLAAFMWNQMPKDAEASAKAESIAKEALAGLEAHEKELPELYAKLFRRDLLALLQLHLPALAARWLEQSKNEQKNTRNQFEVAYSMLDAKDGTSRAIDMVRGNLSSGRDPQNMLIFFLGRLEQQQSPDLSRLLTEIVAIEEQRAGTIPLNALLQIIRFYLKDDTSAELRERYLITVVRSIQLNYDSLDEDLLRLAYTILNNGIIPRIQVSLPSLYPIAQSLATNLASRLPQVVLDRAAMRDRIDQSDDPLNQSIIEADAAKDEAAKKRLLAEAAQLALAKGQFKQAIDLIPATSDDPDYKSWHDQFLNDVVSSALKQKNPDWAGYAASKINADLSRALASEKMAQYYFDAKDLAYARELLNEAVKSIEKSDSNADKAREYLNIALIFMKIDEVRVTEMIQAAIKSINSIPQPKIDDKADSRIRQDYAKTLTGIGFNLIPIFRAYAQKDEIATNSLANEIHRPEVKAFALFGTCTGVLSTGENVRPKSQN